MTEQIIEKLKNLNIKTLKQFSNKNRKCIETEFVDYKEIKDLINQISSKQLDSVCSSIL